MIMTTIMSTAYLYIRAGISAPVSAVVLACALAFAATPSRAADPVYDQQSPEPPAAYAVGDTYVWNGPYLGLYGGYNSLGSDISGLPDVDNIDGLSGGVFGGINRQFAPNWIAGLEGTLGMSGADHTFGGTKIDQDWEASLRARMGYAFENSMIYGLAGVAGSEVNASTASGTDSKVLLGWQIGAGLETVLTREITGRVEYDYTDYNAREFSLGASGSPNIGLSGHTVKFGVGFKF